MPELILEVTREDLRAAMDAVWHEMKAAQHHALARFERPGMTDHHDALVRFWNAVEDATYDNDDFDKIDRICQVVHEGK